MPRPANGLVDLAAQSVLPALDPAVVDPTSWDPSTITAELGNLVAQILPVFDPTDITQFVDALLGL